MPHDEVVLNPEEFAEGAKGGYFLRAWQPEAHDSGGKRVGDKAHEGIHLNERDEELFGTG